MGLQVGHNLATKSPPPPPPQVVLLSGIQFLQLQMERTLDLASQVENVM